ncbi:hypothetical protein FRB90_012486, partial [Tulasnella sp. 427]
ETAALEDPNLFFPLLDLLVHPGTFEYPLITESPKGLYINALSAIKESKLLEGDGVLDSFEKSLALRAASPRLEAFHSYYTQRYGDPTPTKQQDPNCVAWVDWYGQRICRPDDLFAAAGYHCPGWVEFMGHRVCGVEDIDQLPTHQSKAHDEPQSLTFDHIFPASSSSTAKTAILYGSVSSPNFFSLHYTLYQLAKRDDHPIRYVFRHLPPLPSAPANPAYLTGYGVAMDLKKMDYLALDDRRTQGSKSSKTGDAQKVLSDEKEATPEEDPILSLLPKAETPIDLGKPLTNDELTALGFKTSQVILESPNPLATLKQLSQNFPKYATSISHRVNPLNESIVVALGDNMRKVQSGANMVWLNGRPVQATDMNPFALLRLMRKERKLISQLTSAGLSRSEAVEILTHPSLTKPSAGQLLEGMFDASDRKDGGGVIIWLNDLEKEDRYSRWPSTLDTIMKPAYGGQVAPVRRNLFNIILALDLSKTTSVSTLNLVTSIVQRGYPFRFGVVPIAETEDATAIAKVFYYLNEQFEPLQAAGIFMKAADARRPSLSLESLERVFTNVAVSEPEDAKVPWKTFDEITSSWDSVDLINRLTKYCERLALTNEASKGGHLFVNGKYSPLSDDWIRNLQTDVGEQTQFLQEAIWGGEVVDSEELDMSNWFYDLPTTAATRNAHIYPSSSGASALKIISMTDVKLPGTFIYHPETKSAALSIWIVGDLENPSVVNLIVEGLQAMTSASSFRLSFVHVPNPADTAPPKIAPALFGALISEPLASPDDIIELITSITSSDEAAAAILSKIRGDGDGELTMEKALELMERGIKISQQIGFKQGDVGIIVNGRVVGPLPPSSFTASDFHTLVSYEKNKRIAPINEALQLVLDEEQDDTSSRLTDNLLAKVSSIILADQIPESGMVETTPTPRSRPYSLLESVNASFAIGNNETAMFHFGIILNPVSDIAQKYSSLMEWLAEDDLVHAVVYLNPPHQVEEMPLKRFYRYNLTPRLTFDESTALSKAKVEFTGLPRDPIYTLGMDVPQSWLARPSESVHDLDNVQLSSLGESEQETGVEALFRLDYLVIEGHARDAQTRAPPRGLQLQLSSDSKPVADTQVVANLGYFQLKAKPGVFQLEIRQGRGQEIFEMLSAGNEGWDSPSVEAAGADITVASFEGITLYPTFQRREGMENADVLAEAPGDHGFFGNIASKVGSIFGSSQSTEIVKRQADINIFTVASGHLYERFASIMILSVMKNTRKTVKFWFIENFLSPSFLEFIPHFAEEYGFEYELVTYKWPSWLRMPTEKQRIIWGYKILFLDVLFPMDLKKVIFVDADQIVRTDLHELVTLDLHGAPYGYTPMGDDSEDMDGFRFWKTGYWKDHLRGRPYHISALYVVDLVRFRQLAAGDRLRGQYQGLSADPHSLANLDQDLPNNMQAEVPIFSLHEDWLWCETWCSKDRFHRAKTIDLCQNPKTKEPKLSRARQIPEWELFDMEIATFARKLADSGLIRSHAAAENVDALAGEAKQSGSEAAKEQHAQAHEEL